MMKIAAWIVFTACLFFGAPLSAQHPILLLTDESAPFVSQKLEGYGFLPEIISVVFKEMGLMAVYRFYPWKRCEFLVEAGEAWATFPYSYTEERAEKFYFSDPVSYSVTLLFHYKEDGKFNFEAFEDLKKYKLGGVQGYFYEEMFQKEGINVSYFRNEMTAFKKLISGRVDLLPMNEIFAWHFLNKNFPQEIVSNFGWLKKPLSHDPLRLMVSKEYPNSQKLLKQFNFALKKTKTQPAYDTVLEKYGIPLEIR